MGTTYIQQHRIASYSGPSDCLLTQLSASYMNGIRKLHVFGVIHGGSYLRLRG